MHLLEILNGAINICLFMHAQLNAHVCYARNKVNGHKAPKRGKMILPQCKDPVKCY